MDDILYKDGTCLSCKRGSVSFHGGRKVEYFCYKKNKQLPEIIRDCKYYCYNKKNSDDIRNNNEYCKKTFKIMKKLFYVLLLCISFVSCNEGYHKVVVIRKERIHHTIKSDRFFIIAEDENGNKHSFDVFEREFVKVEIGDTINKYY